MSACEKNIYRHEVFSAITPSLLPIHEAQSAEILTEKKYFLPRILHAKRSDCGDLLGLAVPKLT
jgi:hypothetical protein